MRKASKISLKINTSSTSTISDSNDQLKKSPKQSFLYGVNDQIYIGGYYDAMDYEKLKDYKITDIINCSPSNCPNIYEKDFQYFNFQLFDSPCFDINLTLQLILNLIQKLKNGGAKILIHCFQGVSRAPAVAMAYLIMFENKNVEDALSLIKKNYSKAEPNIGFVLQLEELYTKNLNENLESETGLEKKIKIYI